MSICVVCGRAIGRMQECHTYHAPGCPWRDPDHDGNPATPCAQLTDCGEDVHGACCPTCNWDPTAVGR